MEPPPSAVTTLRRILSCSGDFLVFEICYFSDNLQETIFRFQMYTFAASWPCVDCREFWIFFKLAAASRLMSGGTVPFEIFKLFILVGLLGHAIKLCALYHLMRHWFFIRINWLSPHTRRAYSAIDKRNAIFDVRTTSNFAHHGDVRTSFLMYLFSCEYFPF